MSLPDDSALTNFVLQEARLLDAARYQEWLELFAADGRYWVPLEGAEQVPAQLYNAYADEDRLLLRLRIERLQDPRAWSQQPRSRGQHLLQTPRVERREAAQALLHTPFLTSRRAARSS
jgi:3-phenylpropionate/cinnamic acid dioxygenase small subunit